MTGRRGRPAKKAARAKNSGSLRELKEGELYQLRLPSIDGEAGATRRFRGTLADARIELARWVDERKGLRADGTSVTLADWCDEFMATYSATTHATSTRTRYAEFIEYHIKAKSIGKVAVAALDSGDISRWYAGIVNKGANAGGVAKNRAMMSRILSYAVERRVIRENPVRYTSQPNVRLLAPTEDKSFLTLEQAHKFIEACQQPDELWGPYFLTCVRLGLRPGEGLALAETSVDFDQRTVHIKHTIERAGQRPVGIGPTKRTRSGKPDDRTVELDDVTADALKRQQAINLEWNVTPADPMWEGLIFLPDTGVPPWSANVRHHLDRVCWDAGVPRLSPYELRHSCASILLDAGMPEERVARMLGTSVEMLRRHYRHWLDPVARGGGDAWNRALGAD